jgi:hypothetical protein
MLHPSPPRSAFVYGLIIACLLISSSCTQEDVREPSSPSRIAGGDTLDAGFHPSDGLRPNDRLVLLECCSGDSLATPDTVVIKMGHTVWFALVHGDSAAVDMMPSESDYEDVVDDTTKRKTLSLNEGRVTVGFHVTGPPGLRPYEVTIYGCEEGEEGARQVMMLRGIPVMDIRE